MNEESIKLALFALQDIVRGGLPGQYIKRKGAQILKKTTPSYYREKSRAAGNIAAAYKSLDPATRQALQGSELVRAGMTPEGALAVAHMSSRKGESTVDAIRRLTSGVSVPPPPRRVSPTQATVVRAPRTVPSAPAARTTAPAVPKPLGPTIPATVPSRRVHGTAATAPTILTKPTKLGSARFSMLEELTKICADDITQSEARRSLARLKSLESQRTGELLRGAGVGAAAGPVIGAVGRAVSGAAKPRKLLRDVASQAATGAMFGGALPFARTQLERAVEREHLKDYLEGGRRKGFRRTVARTIGV